MQDKVISGYTLKKLLGKGGMAEVWYAENNIGKTAAVKILLPKLCEDQNVMSRFRTEAMVMVGLNHPNIRQVYDYGEIDGRPAIVMEYLEGDDLKERMKRGQRFSEADLEKWWNQLIDALNYTHQKGVVHRDIKPGNIFVDYQGNIKLLDFGIAKVRESISSTQTGQKLGTLMYMSPEQVKDSKHIDYRTDVYSLAVTFVNLITGKKPYDTETSSDFDISEQIVYKPLDLSGVPEDWAAFLTPYLEKDPAKRPELQHFHDVAASAADETEIGGARPSQPKPRTESEPKYGAEKQPQKKRKKRAWIALALIAMAVVLLLWLTMGGRMHETDPYNSSEILPILEESPILNTIPGREAGLQIPAENAIEPESEGNAIAPAESQHQADNNNVQNAIQQGQQNAGSIPVQPIQNNVQNAIQQGQQNAGNTPHPGINHPGANVDQPTQPAGL